MDPCGWKLIAPQCQSYADVPASSPYYADVETLKAHRIGAELFEGAEPGEFAPDAPISRADAVEAIYLAHRPYAVAVTPRVSPSGS